MDAKVFLLTIVKGHLNQEVASNYWMISNQGQVRIISEQQIVELMYKTRELYASYKYHLKDLKY